VTRFDFGGNITVQLILLSEKLGIWENFSQSCSRMTHSIVIISKGVLTHSYRGLNCPHFQKRGLKYLHFQKRVLN